MVDLGLLEMPWWMYMPIAVGIVAGVFALIFGLGEPDR